MDPRRSANGNSGVRAFAQCTAGIFLRYNTWIRCGFSRPKGRRDSFDAGCCESRHRRNPKAALRESRSERQDSSGWTPLMYATRANANQAQAMKVLLDGGANPNVRSYMG